MDIRIEYESVNNLIPYAGNAKIHTEEQVQQICESIRQFGMNDPIAIWKDNTIIEGHGRLIACKKMGIKEVPVIRLDELTDKQRKAYTLIHNKLTMNTGFDYAKLREEIDGIEEIDMVEFGFADFDETFSDDYTSNYDGGESEPQVFNCIISCIGEEEKQKLAERLGIDDELEATYYCSDLMGVSE